MLTLRQLRENYNLSLTKLSEITNINIPTLSRYESGVSVPTIEDCVVIERQFNQYINWGETGSKSQLIDDITNLMERYPVESVLNFAVRWLRYDHKQGKPQGTSINVYRKVSDDIEPGGSLLPPGVK